jgi:hypothetical protein
MTGGEDRMVTLSLPTFSMTPRRKARRTPGKGIQAVRRLSDLATLVVPDLYVPEPLPDQELSLILRPWRSGFATASMSSPFRRNGQEEVRMEKLHLTRSCRDMVYHHHPEGKIWLTLPRSAALLWCCSMGRRA